MTKDGENLLQALLPPLGFVAEGRQTWTLWRLPPETLAIGQAPAKTAPGSRSSTRLHSPWRVTTCELAERRGALSLLKLEVSLDRSTLLANFAKIMRRHFGARTSGSFVPGAGGDVWCVFEFTRPGTREKAAARAPAAAGLVLPLGVGGFDVRLAADGAHGEILVTDLFGFGYLPPTFGSAPLRFVAEAFGLSVGAAAAGFELRGESINELRFPLHLPVLLALHDRGASDAALALLHASLAKMRATPSPVVLVGELGLTIVTPGETVSADSGMKEVSSAPLEVLESRERAERYRDVDQLLLSGRSSRALKLAAERLGQDPDELYLMRRLALLALAGHPGPDAAFLRRALELEADSKLFLSLAVAEALAAGDQPAVLEALSRLGARLTTEIPGADVLPQFSVVLPELLGDAWAGEDPLKAEECYQRVLERRGDLPRVLRKLINLARARGLAEQEVGYLYRLTMVERRRSELARLTLRLAELRRAHATGQEEAVQLALKALKLDRAFVPAARFAADLLVESGRPAEGVQLLDSVLKDARLPLPAAARAELEASVGHIWRAHLGRPDLAETRFEQAVAHDRRHLSSLRELEALQRSRLDHVGLARVLELQFDACEAAGDGVAMKRLFDELVPLYRGPLGQPQRAYELYRRLLIGDTTAQDVDLLLGWNDVDIDWQSLYAKLALSLPKLPPGPARGQFLCRLAEVVREKLGNATLALRHLRGALDEGWIEPSGFQILIDTLAREHDYAGLAYAYERRLGQVPPAEQCRILTELVTLPEVLSEARRDQLAVQAALLDPTSDVLVQQRFQAYQSLQDVDSVERLLGLLLAERRLTTLQKLRWLRHGIELLEGMEDDRRFALIDGLYRRLLEIGEDRVEVLQDAVASLKGAPDAARLAYYVAELLGVGILPALDERRIQSLLTGFDHELALYHQLMSFKITAPETAASHARIAAALYGKRANQEANTEKMLVRLCTLVPCAESDLAQLRALVARSGNWVLLAKALQSQADFEDERQHKYALLEQLGVLYWKKLKEYARARLTFVLAMKHAPHPAKLKLVLATIAAEAGDASQERKALVDFLVDPAATEDFRTMSRAVGRLLQLGEEGAALHRLVRPYLDQAEHGGDWEKVGQLAKVLLDNQIASTEIFRTAFKAALFTGQDAHVVDSWWRGLACVSNKSKAKAYMIETAAMLAKEGRRDLQLASYGAALDQGIGERIGPKIEHELRLQYGALLFDTDHKRRKALSVYREAYGAEPTDHRTWMPLYFLLLEFGTPAERLAHLTEILPKLVHDQRPLKQFPLTIESLRAELKELREQTLKDGGSRGEAASDDSEPVAGAAPAILAFARPAPQPPEFGDLGDDEAQDVAVDMRRAAGDGSMVSVEAEPTPAEHAPVARSFTVVGRGEGLGAAAASALSASSAASTPGGSTASTAPSTLPPPASAASLPKAPTGQGKSASGTARPRALPPLPSMTRGEEDQHAASEPAAAPATSRPRTVASRGPGAAPFAAPDVEMPGGAVQATPPAVWTEASAPEGGAAGDPAPTPFVAPGPPPWQADPAGPGTDAWDPGASGLDLAGQAGASRPADAVPGGPSGSSSSTGQPDDVEVGGWVPDFGAPGAAQPGTWQPERGLPPSGGRGAAPVLELADAAAQDDLGAAAFHPWTQAPSGGGLPAAADASLPAPPPAVTLDFGPDVGAAPALSLDLDAGAAPMPPPPRPPLPVNVPGSAAGSLSLSLDAPLADSAALPGLASLEFAVRPAMGSLASELPAATLPPDAASSDSGASLQLPPVLLAAPAPGPASAVAGAESASGVRMIPGVAAMGAHGRQEESPAQDLELVAGSVADAGLGEVSSVELAVAIDASHSGGSISDRLASDRDGSDATPPRRSALSPASGAGLSLPRPDGGQVPGAGRVDDSAASGAVAPPPPRFGSTQSAQLVASGTSAGADAVGLLPSEAPFGLAIEPVDDVADWRAAVLKGDFNSDLTGRLLKQAFASEIEKHLAIQCVALVAGNCDSLVNWHWQVWRNAGEYGYPLSGKERFPSGMSPPILHSTLHKLVLTAAPALVRVFQSRYTLEHVAKKLKISPAAAKKLRRPMAWNEGILRDAGFHLYAAQIKSRGYLMYNLPGLGREIFYEGSTRSLHVDEAHYRKAPPSHLFHRVARILWSIRIHYFVPLALHPTREFMPFLNELGKMFSSASFSRLAVKLGARKGSDLAKRLEGLDLSQLRVLHEKLGRASEEQVAQLWDAMQLHLYRLLVAETLDVIGIFEAILDQNLLRKNAMKHSELYRLSPFAKPMMEFVTKLRL